MSHPRDQKTLTSFALLVTSDSRTLADDETGKLAVELIEAEGHNVTVDVARSLFEKELPGFGEHFRRLSYDEVGVAGLMSRATAGVTCKKLIFCLPGSRGAMRTALNEIILPGIGHMLWEVNRR